MVKKEDCSKIVEKYEEWPANIKHVFQDGNNMLFVDRTIMKLNLAHKKEFAETLIGNIAMAFATKKANCNTTLIYDSTKQTKELEFDGATSKLKLKVCNASPSYETSDDALVDWMYCEQNLDEILVVTSDKGIQIRLKELGMKYIMKSDNWFNLVKDSLGEDYNKIVNTTDKEKE